MVEYFKVIFKYQNMPIKVLVLSILIASALQTKSQVSHKKYCECKSAKLVGDDFNYNDSLFGVVKVDSNHYSIKIYNTTEDTFYLFSSYIEDQFLNSEYLKRVDFVKKQYKISFAPFIPFLSTERSDNVVITNSILKVNQIVYDFIRLTPNTYYELHIKIKDAFILSKALKEFRPQNLNKFDFKAKFKKVIANKDVVENYKKYFEFAIYKNVSLLCQKWDYYLKEVDFNKQAKDFTILGIPLK